MKINNKNQFLTLLNQARYYRKNNSFEESVGFYKSALDIDKYAWDTHYELATYYCINQQAKKSLAHFKILISKFPSNVNVCKDFALALSDSSEYQDAIKYFKKTLNLEPKLIDLYVPFAETLRRDRRYLEAIKTLKHVLTVTPQNHTALVTLGLVYRDTEENSKALECLEKASDLAPEQPFYRLQYANLLYKVGLLKLAEIQVKAAINLQENFFDADILYIKILEADYRYKEALDVLEGVLQKNSLNLELFIKKAELYQEINMIDNALIIYDKLLNESPTYLNAILGKFNILLQQGNDNKAKELIEKGNYSGKETLEAIQTEGYNSAIEKVASLFKEDK